MVHLDYRDVRPIYTQIADGFRAQIKAGVLRGEDRLPSVRELAAELRYLGASEEELLALIREVQS